jgi:hypothetical protein
METHQTKMPEELAEEIKLTARERSTNESNVTKESSVNTSYNARHLSTFPERISRSQRTEI